MTTYRELDWNSLRFVKDLLYNRLVTALDMVVGRVDWTQQEVDTAETKAQFSQAVQGLAMALNLIKAWAVLVHVRSGHDPDELRRQPVTLQNLPMWLVDYLVPHAQLELTAAQAVDAHPEALYESIVLLAQIGAVVGKLKTVVLADSNRGESGVWLRAVFEQPPNRPYTTLKDMASRLAAGEKRDQAVAIKLAVLADLCRLNKSQLRLQNNKETGEQALATLLPVSEDAVAQAPDGLRLTGPVVAPTPREQEPVSLTGFSTGSVTRAEGGGPALAKVVAAPTPRLGDVLARKAAEKTEPVDSQGEASDAASVPSALKVPPPDFRDRLVKAMSEAEASLPEAPLPGGPNAKLKATGMLRKTGDGAPSDEDSSDAGNAPGEDRTPDAAQSPNDVSSGSNE